MNDHSPLDFFLWGWIKNKVYSMPREKTCEEMVKRIRTAYNVLPQQMIKNSIDTILLRFEKCKINQGGHIESIL